MSHKSELIMWSLRPIERTVALFEAAIKTDRHISNQQATFIDGVRCSYQILQVYIHLN